LAGWVGFRIEGEGWVTLVGDVGGGGRLVVVVVMG